MGYPGFYPYHTQNRCTAAAGMGSIIKQGLLRRKRIRRASNGGVQDGHSFHQVPKTSPDCIKDCQNCSSSLTADSAPRNAASTLSGKVCAGCRFCRKQYGLKREPQSKQHDQRGDKPYQCRHCPKKFSLKHQLDTHHRVHTGEKPFECRLCGQRSRDYSAMIKHLRTHGGATPYRCTLCLEFCSSLAAMQKHIRNHAMQEFPPDWSISSTYLYISHI
ncbi:zinc finger and BTB domain-containing protein 16-A isoform X2 [Cynoglossus semilaevis]|uniref:zinc finger and BTB domain-containing protein 16-A isoform X2 n=1 Tax=Cynoglossus semilaevis TaxID=244447 RepID=UPI0007DC97CF|nr:zinc finger and BTB domain-containing protein 16-A isoform X2 [Cynoglossus semilaevis]